MEKFKTSCLIDELEKELLQKKFIIKPIDREILSKFEVIGFDLDHTLVLYNFESLTKLLYTCFSRFLVEHKSYPSDILIYTDNQTDKNLKEENIKFREDFVHKYSSTEAVLDFNTGNVISLNDEKKVIKAFHGTKELSDGDIIVSYGESKEFEEFNFDRKGENYHLVFGNFEYHVIPLFLICVNLYDSGILKDERIINYKVIFDDIMESLFFNYNLYDTKANTIKRLCDTGYFFPEFLKNPQLYLHPYSAKELLIHLRSKGKGIFFATNSFFEFADLIMKHTIGEDYLDYFDLAIYYSQKPDFFTEEKGKEAFFLNMKNSDQQEKPGIKPDDLENENIYQKVKKEKILNQGSYKVVESFFKKFNNLSVENAQNKYLYLGDNFYADCYESSSLPNWESIAVCDHISTGFIGSKPSDFKKMWEVEHSLGVHGHQTHSMFFTKQLREKTLFAISNIETLKHLE
jgi:HAD superfamily 5'-nucleotidase-like hydrolase